MKRTTTIFCAVAIVALLVPAVQAITVPNGDLETIYEPGTTTPTTMAPGSFSSNVGPGITLNGGQAFGYGGLTADVADWVTEDGLTSIGEGYGPHSGVHHVSINGSGWGQPGGLIVSADSLGLADGTPLNLSMWAKNKAGPPTSAVTLELLANGLTLAATTSVDPVTTDEWQEFSRTYDAATMTAVSGQDLTIRWGLPMGADGEQTGFDDIALTEVPEPASMVLLLVGALGLIGLRRRR